MTEEIRPNYYKSASRKYRPVLTALGFQPHHFDMECVEAWESLGLQYCAPATHAVKYLWRCGEKDDEAQELRKALFWLNRAFAQAAHHYETWRDDPKESVREWHGNMANHLPTTRQFADAICLITSGELNGPIADA